MNIIVLMGSPRKINTHFMVKAFTEGAVKAGHKVDVFDVCDMNISGCSACEYCHNTGNGECIKDDDMKKVYPVLHQADMLVIASPVYYFSLTAQLQAAIHRFYNLKKLPKATKAVMLLSSKEPDVYDGSIEQYKGMLGYLGLENCGIVTADDSENKTPELAEKIQKLALSL